MNEFDQINNLSPLPRKEIINMQSYSAPLENRRNLLRLDFNENTLGPSQKVYKAIKDINLGLCLITFSLNLFIGKRKFSPS